MPWRASARLLVVLLAGCVMMPHFSLAQETPESRAFKSAARDFEMGVYDLAQRQFTMFIATFPQSPMLAEAILLQARAALAQTNLAQAVNLLSTNLARAGPLAEQYRYYLATARLNAGDNQSAAESFAQFTRDFPNSVLLLEAGHNEALARFKLRDFSRAAALLSEPGGSFQRAALGRSNDVWTARGRLLLAEALFAEKKFSGAEEVARSLREEALNPELLWERENQLCRILVADQRADEALTQSTNLLRAAAATTSPGILADSIARQGEILEILGQFDAAAQVYTNNLAETVPPERRKMSLLRIIEIKLAQDKPDEAAQLLEGFLAKNPEDAASDVALLTLGELNLKRHLTGGGTNGPPVDATNLLQVAHAQFDKLLSTYTNSPMRGKALLQKGWCLWLENSYPDSALAFKAATEALPVSDEQAIARFKLADAQFAQGDYTNALQNYRVLTNDFAGLPGARAGLFPHALFQMIRASQEMNDADGAMIPMRLLLDTYGDSEFSERGMFLVGRNLLQIRKPGEARRVFEGFLKRFGDRPLASRVELALARTYFHEGDWTTAIAKYDDWLGRFPTNELRPRAEFNRAWANYRAGRETNALHSFSNLVVQFPTDRLAPLAQYWVADYFLRNGNYREALRSFQTIFENTNWPVNRLTYEAKMNAGRSAFSAELWTDAIGDRGHFTSLVNDTNCPPDLAAEAWFAFGDTLIRQDPEPTRPLQKFVEAQRAFARIPTRYPTNRLVPLAWGRVGDCHLQLASQDGRQYENATNAYWRVMTNALADIATRSRAEFGLGQTFQRQAEGKPASEAAPLLKAAFEHYYHVAMGQNLVDNEQPDPFWVEKSGLAAARVAEEQKQWRMAIKLYERLKSLLPPVRTRLQERIEKAIEQMRLEKD